MDEFKQMLEDFNAEQKRLSIYMGGSVTFVIDDTPFTIEQFEMFGLGDTILAQAAMQFERDRNFHRLRPRLVSTTLHKNTTFATSKN
jgi:hypothetical protein